MKEEEIGDAGPVNRSYNAISLCLIILTILPENGNASLIEVSIFMLPSKLSALPAVVLKTGISTLNEMPAALFCISSLNVMPGALCHEIRYFNKVQVIDRKALADVYQCVTYSKCLNMYANQTSTDLYFFIVCIF